MGIIAGFQNWGGRGYREDFEWVGYCHDPDPLQDDGCNAMGDLNLFPPCSPPPAPPHLTVHNRLILLPHPFRHESGIHKRGEPARLILYQIVTPNKGLISRGQILGTTHEHYGANLITKYDLLSAVYIMPTHI